jgi:hypothetical protein
VNETLKPAPAVFVSQALWVTLQDYVTTFRVDLSEVEKMSKSQNCQETWVLDMQRFFGSFYNVQKNVLNMGQRLHYETCTFKRIEKFLWTFRLVSWVSICT